MATPRLRCNHCEQPLAGHCPDSNYTCTWLRCTNTSCTADVYDWHHGTLRYTDGTVQHWADVELTDEPPTIEVNDDDAQAG